MGVFADLALTVLAAAAVADGLRRCRTRGALPWQRGLGAAFLSALILAENVPRAGTYFARSGPYPPPARAVDTWLRAQPPGPLVELPFAEMDATRMWFQTRHRHPMFNGYATFPPPRYNAEAGTLSHPQTPEAVSLLRSLGIRYVVIDQGAAPAGGLKPPYLRLYADAQAAVYSLDGQGVPSFARFGIAGAP